ALQPRQDHDLMYTLTMPEWIWHWSGYAVALLALVGVVWALFWDRARGRRRCRRCWYDMAGVPTEPGDLPAACPECGRAHAKPRHLTRTRRRWGRAVVLGLVMVVGGYGLWVVPRMQDEGRLGFVPDATLPWAVWHVRLNKFPQTERWQVAYQQIGDDGEGFTDREAKVAAMRWWLRLGLVDPSGFYGRSDFKTNGDIMTDPFGFTMAGAVFQNSFRIVDMPRWARLERLETELGLVSLNGKIEVDEGGVRRAKIQIGGASFDAVAGTDDWSIEIRPIGGGSGSLVISDFIASAMDDFGMMQMTDQERLAAGWTRETSQFGGESWTPPAKLVLEESAPGEFAAKAAFRFQEDNVGTFELVFVEQSWGQSYPPSDDLGVESITRID
ncbi:MAG: hypothetical protein AAFO89_03455, partial [Planctomycetota bacterium]